MKETIELRLKPELKIVFNTEGFELTDATAPKNSGVYLYKNIKNVKLNKEGRNWFVTIGRRVLMMLRQGKIGVGTMILIWKK